MGLWREEKVRQKASNLICHEIACLLPEKEEEKEEL